MHTSTIVITIVALLLVAFAVFGKCGKKEGFYVPQATAKVGEQKDMFDAVGGIVMKNDVPTVRQELPKYDYTDPEEDINATFGEGHTEQVPFLPGRQLKGNIDMNDILSIGRNTGVRDVSLTEFVQTRDHLPHRTPDIMSNQRGYVTDSVTY